jgi:hypothetical protein
MWTAQKKCIILVKYRGWRLNKLRKNVPTLVWSKLVFSKDIMKFVHSLKLWLDRTNTTDSLSLKLSEALSENLYNTIIGNQTLSEMTKFEFFQGILETFVPPKVMDRLKPIDVPEDEFIDVLSGFFSSLILDKENVTRVLHDIKQTFLRPKPNPNPNPLPGKRSNIMKKLTQIEKITRFVLELGVPRTTIDALIRMYLNDYLTRNLDTSDIGEMAAKITDK